MKPRRQPKTNDGRWRAHYTPTTWAALAALKQELEHRPHMEVAADEQDR
jgi:hypothetical protein